MKPVIHYLAVTFASLLLLLAAGSTAYGTEPEPGGFVPLAPIPGTVYTNANTECELGKVTRSTNANWAPGCTSNLPKYLRGLYNTGIALAGLFAVFSILRGGFTLLFTDSILGKLEGKTVILQTLGGVIVVFSSYLLMNLINPQLAKDLDLKLEFPRPTLLPRDNSLLRTYTDIERETLANISNIAAETRAVRIGKDGDGGIEKLERDASELRATLYDKHPKLRPESLATLNEEDTIDEFSNLSESEKTNLARAQALDTVAEITRIYRAAIHDIQTSYSITSKLITEESEKIYNPVHLGDIILKKQARSKLSKTVEHAIADIRLKARLQGDVLLKRGFLEESNKVKNEGINVVNTLLVSLSALK